VHQESEHSPDVGVFFRADEEQNGFEFPPFLEIAFISTDALVVSRPGACHFIRSGVLHCITIAA